ncbi:MAG: hypothetical protein WCA21_06555 [Terracidiphilus sp.]
MNRFLAFLVLVCSTVCLAQAPQVKKGATVHDDGTKGIQITFHVTSVRREEDSAFCDTGECGATKFTIEGYSDGMNSNSRVEYVLTCDELLAFKPTTHIAISCGSVHADSDYNASVFGSSISFWPREKYAPQPFRGAYKIISEKEVSKPNK